MINFSNRILVLYIEAEFFLINKQSCQKEPSPLTTYSKIKKADFSPLFFILYFYLNLLKYESIFSTNSSLFLV
jgi:hypothetical protein